MVQIEKYRQSERDSAVKEMEETMRTLGWEDPDGTVVVQEEDWDLIVGLFGPNPEGFRLETELDRKRQEKRESEHPEAVEKIGDAIVRERRYR